MSRILPLDNLHEYLSQIHSLVLSLWCNHTSMKCVHSSNGDFQFIACPIRLMEEMELTHPAHGLLMQTLETFHKKYDGCSSKTLLFVLTSFYMQFRMMITEENQCMKILDYLEELIDQSKVYAENALLEPYSVDSNLFRRICRCQTIYSEPLYQAYQSHSSDFMHITPITRVKSSEEKCSFIPGTILPTNVIVHGCRRTILIDGHLHEDYVHRGYNNQLKLQRISSKKSAWRSILEGILQSHSIEVILCSGTVDERLKDSRIFLENIPTKILRLLGEDSIIHYLTDLTDQHILSINYSQPIVDSSLTMIDKGATLLQYVPVQAFVEVKQERLVHCLARSQRIVVKKFCVRGSGEFEENLIRYWSEKVRDDFLVEKSLAYEMFLECLQLFHRTLLQRKDLFEANLLDDFDSKIDAWKVSIELLKILLQIDRVVQILNTDEDENTDL